MVSPDTQADATRHPSLATLFIEQFQTIYFACHLRHHHDVPRGRIISEQQLHVLGHLDRVRAMRIGELASHMGLSHSSVSLTIDRLQRDGYVKRERHEGDACPLIMRGTLYHSLAARAPARCSRRS